MEKKHELSAKITVKLTDQDIEDIIVTALECGIGYWACLDNTSETYMNAPDDEPVAITASKILLDGGDIKLLDDEDHDTYWFLNLTSLYNGLSKWISGWGGMTAVEKDMLDTAYVDAEAADIIVQLALFGELVHG